MSIEKISAETTVAQVLERLPHAIPIFEEHGVSPAKQCGPMLRVTRLADTPSLCHVQDIEQLIEKLNRLETG